MSEYQQAIADNPALMDTLAPHWTYYIPHAPHPKQLAFTMMDCREVLFGGAGGGGKSDALLMAALQYVNIPEYSAIIFRRAFTDLSLPDALIDRSHKWLDDTDANWNGVQHNWTFRCADGRASKLSFGYLDTERSKNRYKSSQYQFIGFDEVTEFYREDYEFLFSRLRKSQCTHHKEFVEGCLLCAEFHELGTVPLRMRCASNPGGIGHQWVKDRFDIQRRDGQYRGLHPTRVYLPAKIRDNPALDAEEYEENLREISDPITRKQIMDGDWSVEITDGRFRRPWARYYSMRENYIVLGPDGRGESIPIQKCRCFMIVDPAASAREGPGDQQNFRSYQPSYTVVSTWLVTPCKKLIWWGNDRFREEIPEVIGRIGKNFEKYRPLSPEFVGIENSGLGLGVYQAVQRLGLPVKPLRPKSQDKLVRATEACNRMEQGLIWLPQRADWKEAMEDEVFGWTGHKHQSDDQVDVLSYAAKEVTAMVDGGRMTVADFAL